LEEAVKVWIRPGSEKSGQFAMAGKHLLNNSAETGSVFLDELLIFG
jgi:hypothetical protein